MFNKMISSNYLFDCITYDSNQKKKKKRNEQKMVFITWIIIYSI